MIVSQSNLLLEYYSKYTAAPGLSVLPPSSSSSATFLPSRLNWLRQTTTHPEFASVGRFFVHLVHFFKSLLMGEPAGSLAITLKGLDLTEIIYVISWCCINKTELNTGLMETLTYKRCNENDHFWAAQSSVLLTYVDDNPDSLSL